MSQSHAINCPTCKARLEVEANWPSRPFCSERCKMADLGRWLDGEFVISRPMTLEEALEVPVDDA